MYFTVRVRAGFEYSRLAWFLVSFFRFVFPRLWPNCELSRTGDSAALELLRLISIGDISEPALVDSVARHAAWALAVDCFAGGAAGANAPVQALVSRPPLSELGETVRRRAVCALLPSESILRRLHECHARLEAHRDWLEAHATSLEAEDETTVDAALDQRRALDELKVPHRSSSWRSGERGAAAEAERALEVAAEAMLKTVLGKYKTALHEDEESEDDGGWS